MKFKIGDRVTLRDKMANFSFKGKIGKVVCFDKDGVGVNWPDEMYQSGFYFFSLPDYELELVENALEYKENVWYGWIGGECPVPPNTKVSVKFHDGSVIENTSAQNWDWEGPERYITYIVAFLIESYKEEGKVFVGWNKGVFMSDENLFERATHIFHEDGTLELIEGD